MKIKLPAWDSRKIELVAANLNSLKNSRFPQFAVFYNTNPLLQ